MNHYKKNTEYILKNWAEIAKAAKKELADFQCGSIFVALYRTTGHDLHTDGNEEIMSVGGARLVVGRCDCGTWSLVRKPTIKRLAVAR